MPQTFKIKNSSIEDKVPAAGDLATAELALNLKDQKLYSKDADGNVFEIGADQDVSGFVKLDDEGVGQVIDGGGGLTVKGPGYYDGGVNIGSANTTSSSSDGVLATSDGQMIVQTLSTKNLYEGWNTKSLLYSVDASGGISGQFGTSSAQLGNVAPLNDWSCYPARGTTTYTQPTPPEPVDPEFGVDIPIFSGDTTSAGIVGTQDIINLEGE